MQIDWRDKELIVIYIFIKIKTQIKMNRNPREIQKYINIYKQTNKDSVYPWKTRTSELHSKCQNRVFRHIP